MDLNITNTRRIWIPNLKVSNGTCRHVKVHLLSNFLRKYFSLKQPRQSAKVIDLVAVFNNILKIIDKYEMPNTTKFTNTVMGST